jgi:hypothetical protein
MPVLGWGPKTVPWQGTPRGWKYCTEPGVGWMGTCRDGMGGHRWKETHECSTFVSFTKKCFSSYSTGIWTLSPARAVAATGERSWGCGEGVHREDIYSFYGGGGPGPSSRELRMGGVQSFKKKQRKRHKMGLGSGLRGFTQNWKCNDIYGVCKSLLVDSASTPRGLPATPLLLSDLDMDLLST